MALVVEDLGRMPYRQAWALQEAANERVAAGGPEHLFLVEHPPVITFGRRRAEHHVVAPVEQLSGLGIEAIATDRGGDVTFHGPGQLVAYPIVRLIDHRLSIGAYVRRLEDVVIATLARFGIEGLKDESAIGVWVRRGEERDKSPEVAQGEADGQTQGHRGRHVLAKICALGVRIRRGVSMHGIALNVDTDLRQFDLIVPCGIADRTVTSMCEVLGPAVPAMQEVKAALVEEMGKGFGASQSA